ncbi:ATP-binding cassette domain-containing protein [Alteromonas gracilis]
MLTTRGLTRRFGTHTAVDHVDIEVHPGRITGFVGANGAGKTTTMRMILGVLAASEGEVLWDGSPLTAAQRRRIGYMPEERGLYPRMSVIDQLVFLGRLYGMARTPALERARGLLEHFGLADRCDDLLDELSLGNQQRVQIAAALVHHPEALVLDEPFSGLDPLAVDAMTELLLGEAGDRPLLFSSHQLDLVERLCDDLIILSAGRVVAAGSVEELRARGPERFRVRLEGEDAGWMRDLRGVEVREVSGPDAVLDLAGRAAADLLSELTSRSRVSEFARVHQPLSDIYREVA